LQDVFIALELYPTPYEQSFSKIHDRGSLNKGLGYRCSEIQSDEENVPIS